MELLNVECTTCSLLYTLGKFHLDCLCTTALVEVSAPRAGTSRSRLGQLFPCTETCDGCMAGQVRERMTWESDGLMDKQYL